MVSHYPYSGVSLFLILTLGALFACPSYSHARQSAPVINVEGAAPEVMFSPLSKIPGSGYLILGEAEYGISVDSFKTDFLKFSLINGYRFSPFFSLGFGAGAKLFLIKGDADLVIPLFLDARVYFTDRKIAPYLSLGIGYSVDIISYSDDKGNHLSLEAADIMLNPTAGVRCRIARQAAVNVGIGCEMQSMRLYNNTQHSAKSAGNSTCISINAGFSF